MRSISTLIAYVSMIVISFHFSRKLDYVNELQQMIFKVLALFIFEFTI